MNPDTKFSTSQGLSIETNRGLGVYQMGDEITVHVVFSDITMSTKLIPGHWSEGSRADLCGRESVRREPLQGQDDRTRILARRWEEISICLGRSKASKDALFKHDTPWVYCRSVNGLRIHGLELQWGEGLPEYFSDAIFCEDFRDLQIDRFEGRQAQRMERQFLSLEALAFRLRIQWRRKGHSIPCASPIWRATAFCSAMIFPAHERL